MAMPKRGESASAKQRAALERGQKKRREALQSDTGHDHKKRWRALLDGTLKVSDLEDEEIAKMRVYGKGQTFSGPAPMLPSHLAQAFKAEAIKRAQDKFRTAAPEAVAALIELGSDPDVKPADRIRALQYVVDRALGKTPETIRVESGSPFEEFLTAAGDVDLNRSMDDAAPDDAGSLDPETR